MKHFFICILTLLFWSGEIVTTHSAPTKNGSFTSTQNHNDKINNRFVSRKQRATMPSSPQKKWKHTLHNKFSAKTNAKSFSKKSAFSSNKKHTPTTLAEGDENWIEGFHLPGGLNDEVDAIAIDGSGNVYIGGFFTTAGGQTVNYIAKWNGSSWLPMGTGMDGPVLALAIDESDNLYAGGYFTTAGGAPANYIAKWNGSSWSGLNGGMDDYINALTFSNGILYVGGEFTEAGSTSANYIAKWDGSAWSALDVGTNAPVYALTFSNGSLYVGGEFTNAGGISANFIALWNGDWAQLSTGMDGPVYALTYGNGSLYAGGEFNTAGSSSANYIAEWSGSSWTALGAGTEDIVYALDNDGAGNVYAGGMFDYIGGSEVYGIAKWNGSTWSDLDGGVGFAHLDGGMTGYVFALAIEGQDIYTGGLFSTVGNTSAYSIAKWSTSEGVWSNLGTGSYNGVNSYVYAVASDGIGNVYIGGDFTDAGGIQANNIAMWDGNTWQALGTGMNGPVRSITIDESNNVYAGGEFTTAGGQAVNYIAQWNGSSWSGLNGGMDGNINALTFDESGALYAGGYFTNAGGVAANYIAKWDGATWSALAEGTNDEVNTIAIDGNGLIYAGGYFTEAGSEYVYGIAKWEGGVWTDLDEGMDGPVLTIAIDGNNNIYAGGLFSSAGSEFTLVFGVAKWDGSAWSALDKGLNYYVHTLTVSANNNLYAGGEFTRAGSADIDVYGIAKWNGSAWSALGSGMNAPVYALALDGNGNLCVGGEFSDAGEKPSLYYAMWQAGEIPLPVELSAFNGKSIDTGIQLNWLTQTETDNLGFILLRNGAQVASYKSHSALKGQGTSLYSHTYNYLDETVEPGKTYTYSLISVDYSGLKHEYTKTVEINIGEEVSTKVIAYALYQNYPNPFNPSTTIQFNMKQAGIAGIDVYDMLGRRVFEKQMQALKGNNSLTFDGSKLTSGMYFYRLSVEGKYEKTMKMMLVK